MVTPKSSDWSRWASPQAIGMRRRRGRRRAATFDEQQPRDDGPGCAQRHPHSDLARALQDVKGQHAVEANGRHERGEDAEGRGEQGERALLSHAGVDLGVHCDERIDRQLRIKLLHRCRTVSIMGAGSAAVRRTNVS